MGQFSIKASEIVVPDKKAYLSGKTGINIDGEAIHEAVNEHNYSTHEFIKKQVDEAAQKLGPKPNSWGIWNVDRDGDIFSELEPAGHRVEKQSFQGDELLDRGRKKDLAHINFHGFLTFI